MNIFLNWLRNDDFSWQKIQERSTNRTITEDEFDWTKVGLLKMRAQTCSAFLMTNFKLVMNLKDERQKRWNEQNFYESVWGECTPLDLKDFEKV